MIQLFPDHIFPFGDLKENALFVEGKAQIVFISPVTFKSATHVLIHRSVAGPDFLLNLIPFPGRPFRAEVDVKPPLLLILWEQAPAQGGSVDFKVADQAVPTGFKGGPCRIYRIPDKAFVSACHDEKGMMVFIQILKGFPAENTPVQNKADLFVTVLPGLLCHIGKQSGALHRARFLIVKKRESAGLIKCGMGTMKGRKSQLPGSGIRIIPDAPVAGDINRLTVITVFIPGV